MEYKNVSEGTTPPSNENDNESWKWKKKINRFNLTY